MADLCPVIPCSLSAIMPTAGDCGSFADPSNLMGEQLIFDQAFNDLINNFGITIEYYVNGYNLSAANNFYGEHPLQLFYGPVQIKTYLELNEANLALSKFGFEPSDDLTAYLHIDTFTSIFTPLSYHVINGQRVEPKSGDLMKITPLGCDRPGGRGPKIFIVTERLDQDVNEINPMLGHYVYRLKAKRYTYSYETNAPREAGDEQVYDNTFAGKLSSSMYPTLSTEEKSYPGNVDESSIVVYDQDVNNTSVYGSYY